MKDVKLRADGLGEGRPLFDLVKADSIMSARQLK